MKAREKKRITLTEKYASKRSKLKAIIKKSQDFMERMTAQVQLQKLPNNSSKIRITKRCNQCARPRGVYKRFGLCRMCLRKFLMQGDVPGGRKSSW